MKSLVEEVGGIGIIADTDPEKLPTNAWSDGENVRFVDGVARKCAGTRSLAGSLSSSAYSLFYLDTLDGTHHFIYAGLERVHLIDNAVHHDITRVTTSGTVQLYSANVDDLWTGGTLNGLLFLNNGTDHPQIQLTATASCKLSDLPNWPTTITTRAASMRSFKNFLVALDITKGATRYRQMVKWSSIADPFTPPPSWDEADPTEDAGEVNLAETNGSVIDCLPLRDVNIIYKDDSVWGMQYTGDNAIFNFYKIYTEVGILTRNCAAAFEGMHCFLGADLDVYVHDGANIRSIGQSKWREWIRDNLSAPNYKRAFVVANPVTTEIWICIPTGNSSHPSKALLWNWRQDTWGLRTLPNVSSGIQGVISSAYFATWGVIADTWDSITDTWSTLGSAPASKKLVLASPTYMAGLVETESGTQELGQNMSFFLARTGLWAFGTSRFGVDLESVKFIRRVRFRTTGSADVTFNIRVRTDISTTETYQDTVKSMGTTAEVNVLKRGRFLDVRMESIEDTAFELLGMEVEYEESGRYL